MNLLDPTFLGDSLGQDSPCLDDRYLDGWDQAVFLIGGSIALCASTFLIIGFFRFKKLRKQPGDLIIGISISDFILSVQWIITALFPSQVDDPTFCTTIGVFGTFAGYTEYLYNTSFCVYLMISLKNALTQQKIPRKTFHIVNIGFAIGAVAFLYAKGDIGKTFFGTCSVKTSCTSNLFSTAAPIIALFYIAVASSAFYYIKKNSPTCMRADARRAQFLSYYLRYIVATSIIFFTIAIIQWYYVGLNIDDINVPWLKTLGNASKLCIPLVLSTVRYKDPLIQGVMRKVILCKPNVQPKQVADTPKQTSNLEKMVSTFLLPIRNEEEDEDEDFIIKELQTTRRIELTYTLLSCVYYAQIQHHQSNNEQIALTDTKNIYKHSKVYMFDKIGFMQKIDEPLKNELKRVNVNLLNGTLKVYAPDVFNEFIRADSRNLNIKQSLDFVLNREQIEKSSGADGGRSGEFFFFSSDRKLIIKTIPDVEKDMMLKILEKYSQHFKRFPNTLISKAYGLFTYESNEVGLKYNIIITRNVCGFGSEFVERTYDMKGSTFDREVLRRISDPNEIRSRVLKDLDFDHIDKRIKAEKTSLLDLRNQLILDSEFFRSVNLIDYSLIIFVVNKKKYFEKFGAQAEDFSSYNKNASLGYKNSTKDDRVSIDTADGKTIEYVYEDNEIYYNIGIIDYLQPYNCQKMLEKDFKRCKKLDRNLDTSSQDPQTYSTRFITMVRRITPM